MPGTLAHRSRRRDLPLRGSRRGHGRPGLHDLSAPAALAAVAILLTACGEPPEELEGFRLGMSQAEVMEEANRRTGFTCRLRGSDPKITACSGPTDRGPIEALVIGDSAARITLEITPYAYEEDGGREFVKGFGDAAWRDRPYPPRDPRAYHSYWIDRDSTRGLAMVCAGEELEEPCRARLETTSPAGIEAKLDTLLGIRR